MKMRSLSKVQFPNLIDKRYYFSDGIASLPFWTFVRHQICLCELKNSYPKNHKVIENEAAAKHERLRILSSIDAEPITYYKLDIG